jgi:chromosome segregation ATPase
MTKEEQKAAASVAETSQAATAMVDAGQKQEETETVESLRAERAKLRLAVKDANKEAETRRTRLEELEKADQDRQKAALSETDRLKSELAEAQKAASVAEGRAQSERVRSAIEAVAAQLDFHKPHDAYLHIDLSQLEFDAQGNPKNVEDALKELVKVSPYLVKEPGKAAVRPALNPGGVGAVQETIAERRKRLGW